MAGKRVNGQRARRRKVVLKHPSYRPGKVELEERMKIDAPGDTVREKIGNVFRALGRPTKIRYEK